MVIHTESVLHELSTSFTEFKKSIQIKLMKDKGSYISLACTWLTTPGMQTLVIFLKKLKEAKNTPNSRLCHLYDTYFKPCL